MEVHVPQGEGSVSGMVCGIFLASRHALVSIGLMTLRNAFDSCVKSWQYFRTHGIPLNSVSNSLSYDVVRFKIEVGVDAKFTCKNVSKQMRHAHYATGDARRPCFSIDLDFTVNMLMLCVLSNLLLVLSAEERRTILKLLWGLVIVSVININNSSKLCVAGYVAFYINSINKNFVGASKIFIVFSIDIPAWSRHCHGN